jgi:hypothetical protein
MWELSGMLHRVAGQQSYKEVQQHAVVGMFEMMLMVAEQDRKVQHMSFDSCLQQDMVHFVAWEGKQELLHLDMELLHFDMELLYLDMELLHLDKVLLHLVQWMLGKVIQWAGKHQH